MLDAKDAFSKQRLFQAAWEELYPGLLEWVPLSEGGKVDRGGRGDARRSSPISAGISADVANVIPPQQAGRIARGGRRRRPHRLVPDRSGDVRVEAAARHPRHRRRRHRRRACRNRPSRRTPRPRSARRPWPRSCTARAPPTPKLINTCYSLVAPDYGISVAGVYPPAGGQLADVPGAGGVSPLDAPRAAARAEAAYAEAWFQTITAEVFG